MDERHGKTDFDIINVKLKKQCMAILEQHVTMNQTRSTAIRAIGHIKCCGVKSQVG
jgi:hypothetical protein